MKTQILRGYWVPMESSRFHTSDHAFGFVEKCLLPYEKSTNVKGFNITSFLKKISAKTNGDFKYLKLCFILI